MYIYNYVVMLSFCSNRFHCDSDPVIYSFLTRRQRKSNQNATYTNESHVSANTEFEGELFEGDLDISIETIHQFYEIDEMQEEEIRSTFGGNNESSNHVGKHAAASDGQIWSGGIVPFTYN